MTNLLPRVSDRGPMLYTVVIPAFNEADRILPTLDHILTHACERRWNIETIVVDDGSSDATAAVVSRCAARSQAVRLIKNPIHRGKGHCVRTGVMNAGGDVILIIDADLPASMDEAELLLQALAEGSDIAIGSRWLQPGLQQVRQSFRRRNLGRCFNVFVRSLLGLGFTDTQCGFKAFTSHAADLTFRFQRISGWAFDAELLVIAKSLGLAVKEVPIRTHHDARSKLKPIVHGFQMLSDVVQIACSRLCGRYPSPVAPSLSPSAGIAATKGLRTHRMPMPARIGFAMLSLLIASMLMRDVAPVIGSTAATGSYSSLSQTVQSTQNLHYNFQGSAPDADQNSAADDYDDAFDQY